jgi:uncharacterized protein YbcI
LRHLAFAPPEEDHVTSSSAPRDTATEEQRQGSPLLEISNALVRLYKDAFGRGPTKARAMFAGPDTLVVILENSMTVAERNLAAMDEHARLREGRLFIQYALEDEFRAIVERALGRRSLAFISGIDTRRDISVEIFTLEPQRSSVGESEPPTALPGPDGKSGPVSACDQGR